jgi:hypothetical protein
MERLHRRDDAARQGSETEKGDENQAVEQDAEGEQGSLALPCRS